MRKKAKKKDLAGVVMPLFFSCIVFLTCFVPSAFAATWTQAPKWGGFLSSADYSSWAADDFRFMGETIAVSSVDWWSERSTSDPTPQGFYIRFYGNYYDADLGYSYADPMLYQTYIEGFSQAQDDKLIHYSADLTTPFVASANTKYWISVQADFADGITDPWWGWAHSYTQNLSPAEYNSGSYFHHPINEAPFYDGNYDLAFEIQGSPVPLPGAFWLLGSGLFGLAAIRRRRG